jgi:S1-C subfamily serine protease
MNKKTLPITKIVKKVCPAVITITAHQNISGSDIYGLPFSGLTKKRKAEEIKVGGGSGFIVSKDGLVITSCHVVFNNEANYYAILEPTLTYSAKILSRDPINDIAILKIDGKNFSYLKLGDSSDVELGESVIAVGNPLGEFYDTISAGIISGLSRFINAHSGFSEKTTRLKGLIQTDAAINPGNSGGPLINMAGEVVGINTAMVVGSQNLGFAIPINYAKRDLLEVKKYGKIKRPFLGIKYIILNEEISKKNDLPVSRGALVVRERLGEEAVVPKSAAAKAGIKEFDIILTINDHEITEDNYLSDILEKYSIGDEVVLQILRNKKVLSVALKLEEKK